MASYKDSPNLKFSPYVQTLPVEAMAKVGMYKQQRYDQGVQKIQKSIDNIAGLDIVRPEDKQYLQSKLNQLGSQLSSVAGGDFSNFALVNSVNGMTNQIAKDPRVLKDVASSSAYRKALEGRTKLVEQGKGSASNDMLFNEQVNSWMNGGEDASFNSTYRPYSDYESKKREIIKTLTAEKIGKPVIYGPNGKLLNAMTYTEVEELSPQKILTALKQGLSPDEYQQLQIDGRYKYANVSKEQFVSDVNSRFTTGYDKLSKDRSNLMRQMDMLKDVSSKKVYEIEINKLSNEMANLKQQYETTSESFLSGDVESAKARLYANDWFNDSANVYKYKNIKQEYKTNPALADQRKVEQMNRDDARAALNRQHALDLKILDFEKDELNRKLEKEKITQEQYEKELERIDKITVSRAGTGSEEQPKSEELIQKVKNELDVLKTNSDALKATIIQMVDSEVDGGTDNEKFDSALEMYGGNSTLLKVGVKEKIAQYLQNERLLNNQSSLINEATDFAGNVVEKTNYERQVLDNLNYEGNEKITLYPQGYGYDRVNNKDTYKPIGEGYEYTTGEVSNKFMEFENSDVLINKNNVDDVDDLDKTDINGNPIFTPNEKKEIRKLTNNGDPRLLSLYKAYRGYGINRKNSKSREMTDDVFKPIKNQIRKVGKKKQKEEEEYNKAFVDKLKESNVLNEPINIIIPTTTTGEVKELQSKILVLENEKRTEGIVIDIGEGFVDASAAMSAESAFLRRNMDGSYVLNYASGDGKFSSLPITKNEASELFKDVIGVANEFNIFDATYTPMMLQNKNPIITEQVPQEDEDGNLLDPLIVKTQAPLTYYTTAKDGKFNTTPENAALVQYDFPNIGSFEVTGNIVSASSPITSDDQQVFSLQLNVKYPGKDDYVFKNEEIIETATKAGMIKSMNQLSDAVIIGYIENQKMIEKKRKEQKKLVETYINPEE